jgi:lysine-N-methylase
MYKGMYPFSEKGDPYAGYTMLLVRIFLIRTLLVGLSSNGEKLTAQLTVDLIQSFSKTIDHHKTYMNEFLKYLVDSGNDDLECLMKLF